MAHFFGIFHARSFELNLFFDRSFPLIVPVIEKNRIRATKLLESLSASVLAPAHFRLNYLKEPCHLPDWLASFNYS